MNPELSHRVAKVMHSPAILALSPVERNGFATAVARAKSFDELSEQYKALILQAERGNENLTVQFRYKGGAGSGNRGHAGIPGHRGGSRPKGTGAITTAPIPEPVKVVLKPVEQPKSEPKPITTPKPVAKPVSETPSNVHVTMTGLIPVSEAKSKALADKLERVVKRHPPELVNSVHFTIHTDNASFEKEFKRGGSGASPKNVGAFWRAGGSIHLRPDGVKNNMIDHELGHQLIGNAINTKSKWTRDWSSRAPYTRLTDYANTDAHEGFAEAYMLYMMTDGKPIVPRYAQAYDMVREALSEFSKRSHR